MNLESSLKMYQTLKYCRDKVSVKHKKKTERAVIKE